MRDIRSGNCPLCDHHEVVEADPLEGHSDDHKTRLIEGKKAESPFR